VITEEAIEAAARAIMRGRFCTVAPFGSERSLCALAPDCGCWRGAKAALQAAAPLIIADAVKAEREACAELAANYPATPHGALCVSPFEASAQTAGEIASAIRARNP